MSTKDKVLEDIIAKLSYRELNDLYTALLEPLPDNWDKVALDELLETIEHYIDGRWN